jgi:hypothetical protein
LFGFWRQTADSRQQTADIDYPGIARTIDYPGIARTIDYPGIARLTAKTSFVISMLHRVL